MKITDRFVIRNKMAERSMRDLDLLIDKMSNSGVLNKQDYIEVQATVMELLIAVFKQLENNVTPAKTLLDYTGVEVQDACTRVGPSNVFAHDRDFVIAVMQELTK